MNIRERLACDDTEWLRMRLLLWPDLSPDAHRKEMSLWLARPDTIVLFAPHPSDSGLMGFAEVGTRSLADGCETSPVAYLEGWYVDCGMRGRGVGTALIRAAEKWARERGLHEFASDAELENIGSQQAHVALGFQETERSVLYLKKL